uniref:Putative retrotransposon protein n=1 Tax=Phyllostachys edulis TaxID=38705 RepID=D3IVI3_PHYED|nr:putative retrotransposon protein [Phyllostachys edulis]
MRLHRSKSWSYRISAQLASAYKIRYYRQVNLGHTAQSGTTVVITASEGPATWEVVRVPLVLPEVATLASAALLANNNKAKNLLYAGLGRQEYDKICNLETAHEIWHTLETYHEGSSQIKQVRQTVFKSEYNKFEMRLGESIDDVFSRFNKVINQMRVVDIEYSQSENATHLLATINTKEWEMKATTIEENINLSDLILELLYSKLKTHEIKRVDYPKKENMAFIADPLKRTSDGSSESLSGFSLACLSTIHEEELESIPKAELALLVKKFTRVYNNQSMSDADSGSEEDKEEELPQDKKKGKAKDFTGMCFMADSINDDEDYRGRGKNTWVNNKFILKDVALVDKLRYNLLSVSQLLDDGYETRFKKNAYRVLDSAGELVFGISRVGMIFGADFSESLTGSLKCLIASSSEFWLWHRRLEHIGFDQLTRVSSLDLMRGLPKLKAITDAVFFLASKDEVFDHFHDLVLRLASELSSVLRAICSDNGTEFKNASFASFCVERGIEHQFSSPHVPQQNGVVERKNRTLVEMARTILDEYSTPRRFWAETIATACYIANRVFLRPSLGKTSYELRFGRKPSVSHFRVFRAKCFILNIGNLDKFELRTSDGLFLGYPAHSRGFRVFNVETNVVQETCNVTFDETSPSARSDVSGDTQAIESIFVDEDDDEVDNVLPPAADAPVPAPESASTTSPSIEAPAASSSSAEPAEVEEMLSPQALHFTFRGVTLRIR